MRFFKKKRPNAQLTEIILKLTNLENQMTVLDEKLAETTAALTEALAEIPAKISELNASIVTLQDQITAGATLTPEQQTALDAVVAQAQALANIIPNTTV